MNDPAQSNPSAAAEAEVITASEAVQAMGFDPKNIERPDSSLLRYYILVSLLSGPAFPLVFLPLFFKYQTLKYQFDDSGVAMSWGILFRREIHLTFRRIQDIHLNRNLVQRWMGLASLGIQTASGSSTPEMTIEGLLEAEHLRDYLYAQMRGARGDKDPAPITSKAVDVEATDDVTTLLTEIRDSMKVLASKHASNDEGGVQ